MGAATTDTKPARGTRAGLTAIPSRSRKRLETHRGVPPSGITTESTPPSPENAASHETLTATADPTIRTLSKREKLANYVSQLRPYSYADLMLLMLAIGATPLEITQCSLLWFGFLILLEWWHKDDGRLPWPWPAWAATWTIAVAINPGPRLAAFIVVAILYSAKKTFPSVAVVSPLANGAVKGSLALLVVGTSWQTAVLVTAVMAARNLAGDFRDTVKDRKQGVQTIPVRLGLKRNVKFAYPTALTATSAFWVVWGGLPLWYVLPVWLIEQRTYRLTPR
ncbi:MAG: hypothetical protein ACR2QA_14765 [Solirubrobacteraceae bacterium]